MRAEISRLFEPYPAHHDAKDELLAVRDGTKAMAYYAVPANGALRTELVQKALDLGLSVVQNAEGEHVVRVFVLKPSQVWRIPAFLDTRRALYEHR